MRNLLEKYKYPNALSNKHGIVDMNDFTYRKVKLHDNDYRVCTNLLSDKELINILTSDTLGLEEFDEEYSEVNETLASLALWGVHRKEVGTVLYEEYVQAYNDARKFIMSISEIDVEKLNKLYFTITNDQKLIPDNIDLSKVKNNNAVRSYEIYNDKFKNVIPSKNVKKSLDEFIKLANEVRNEEDAILRVVRAQNAIFLFIKIHPFPSANYLIARLIGEWMLYNQSTFVKHTSRAAFAIKKEGWEFYGAVNETNDLTYNNIYNFYLYERQLEWIEYIQDKIDVYISLTNQQRRILFNIFISGQEYTQAIYSKKFMERRSKQMVNNDLRKLKAEGFLDSEKGANRTLKYKIKK